MTVHEMVSKFIARLDEDYLKRFVYGNLLCAGSILDWENLNGTQSITVLDFDGVSVKFKYNEEVGQSEFTLNNFYIFNRSHIDSLLKNAAVFQSGEYPLSDIPEYAGVYVIHDTKTDKVYVGQGDPIMWRIKDHINPTYMKDEGKNEIDRRIQSGAAHTISTIPLSGSGYTNLDALETAVIAYYNSYHKGYNKTRGNNGPGEQCRTKID